MIHELKTWPAYFERLLDGSKTFEIRKNDRGFQAGDELILKEFQPSKYGVSLIDRYTGRELRYRVGFVVGGELFGLDLGEHVVLSLIPTVAGQEQSSTAPSSSEGGIDRG